MNTDGHNVVYCCGCQLVTDLQESTIFVIQKQQGGVEYFHFSAQSCNRNLCLSLPQEKNSSHCEASCSKKSIL